MKNTYFHAVALAIAASMVTAVIFFGLPRANTLAADPAHPDHAVSKTQDGATPSAEGTNSPPGTYIHPVVQDNGTGNGGKDVKGALNRVQQEDYHQSQSN